MQVIVCDKLGNVASIVFFAKHTDDDGSLRLDKDQLFDLSQNKEFFKKLLRGRLLG